MANSKEAAETARAALMNDDSFRAAHVAVIPDLKVATVKPTMKTGGVRLNAKKSGRKPTCQSLVGAVCGQRPERRLPLQGTPEWHYHALLLRLIWGVSVKEGTRMK